jgi:hypothetical protein
MQSTSKGFEGLKTYVLERADLARLVQKSFVDIDPEGRVERIIKAVGWFGMRDRLANIYLTKLFTGSFPEGPPENFLTDILKFEDRSKKQTVDGYSRAFMLAFYFRYALTELKGPHSNENLHEMIYVDDLMSLMKISRSRVVKIDWLLLVLNHFVSFLGKDRCEHELRKSAQFDALWDSLNEDQKELMTSNLLAYAASVQDSELFVSDFI